MSILFISPGISLSKDVHPASTYPIDNTNFDNIVAARRAELVSTCTNIISGFSFLEYFHIQQLSHLFEHLGICLFDIKKIILFRKFQFITKNMGNHKVGVLTCITKTSSYSLFGSPLLWLHLYYFWPITYTGNIFILFYQ